MTRNFRNFLWFLVGCIIAAVPLLSMAETIPATNLYWARWGKVSGEAMVYTTTYRAPTSDNSYAASCSFGGGTYKSGSCELGPGNVYSYFYNGWEKNCPTGQGWTYNSTAQTCTRPDCAPGETRQSDGTCVPPPCEPGSSLLNDKCVSDTCPDGSPRSLGGLCRGQACNQVYGPTAPPGIDYGYQKLCTDQGCQQTSWSNGSGHTVVQGTNGECTPGQHQDPAPCAAGETMQTVGATTKCYPSDNSTCGGRGLCSGNVNGVVVCVSCGPGTSTTRTDSGSSTKTETPAGGGDPTTTESKTTETKTEVSGGQITTTTTTTNEDGSKTTETKTETRAEFCKNRPNDPLCKTNDQDDFCKQHPESLSCVKLGSPAAADPIQTQNKSLSLIVPDISAAGSCPSNVALPHGAEFDYGPMCDFATSIRPLVIGLGWLIGGLMIFAWFKS